MAGLANMFGMGGGMPQVTPEMLEKLKSQLPPGAMPPGMGGGLPATPPAGLTGGPKGPGLPGLGGPKIPGLPGLGGGFNPFGGKKK
jgi:signal recognition particle subunit SRP54